MKAGALHIIIILILVMCSVPCSYAQKRNKREKDNEQTEQLERCKLPPIVTFEDKVQLLFEHYNKNSLSEKLYLHTDKESCIVGDTIWFAGYLTSAKTNMPADISRFIYVELIDRTDSIYRQEQILCSDSTFRFAGYMPIAEDLRQGEYYLRAFTYWQQNYPDNFIFSKRIRIVNPFDHRIKANIKVERESDERRVLSITFRNHLDEIYHHAEFQYCIPSPNEEPEITTMNTGYNGRARIPVNNPHADKIWIKFTYNTNWDFEGYEDIPGATPYYTMQFFPEGGDMIGNTIQRIAFTAQGSDGKGVAVSGDIYDNNNQHITTFKSNTYGIGSVLFSNEQNKVYYAIARDSRGTERRFELPKPQNDKYALQLTSNKEQVIYDILCSDSLKNSIQGMYVIVISRGVPLLIFNAKEKISQKLNFASAPEGVIQFVLCDYAGNIHSERLWYHKVPHATTLNISYDKKELNKFERNDIPISIRYKNYDTIPFYASLSVINIGQADIDYLAGGIEAYQLLTSDIGKDIEKPGYYLSQNSPQRNYELDNLLLVHGWSRYDTEAIMTNNWIPNKNDYYVERGQFISGRVTNVIGKKGVRSDVVIMGSNGSFSKVETDKDGYFIANDIYFEKDTRFDVQASSKDGATNIELQIDRVKFKDLTYKFPYYHSQPDKEFYKRHSKDYIYGIAGDKIKTLGDVRVTSYVRLTEEQQLLAELEEQARENFHMGFTNIKTWGNHVTAMGVDGAMLPGIEGNNFSAGIFNNGRRFGIKHSYIDYRKLVESWKKELLEMEVNSPKQHFDIENENAFLPVGSYAQVFNPFTSIHNMEISIVPMVDNTVTPTKSIIWNKQSFIPIAPQQKREFYKPAYKNISDMQYEKLDEVITRYWDPLIELHNGNSYNFTFPAAIGGENKKYAIVIDGISSTGEPLHEIVNL